ncbi:restriction endonuclease subunit S [Vibrio parahaemolyticus]|nr:restriction endonuclease subunit S [Vibrio parahaemolyticus]
MSQLPKGWSTCKVDQLCLKPEQVKPADDLKFLYIDIGSVDRETKSISTPTEILGCDAPSRARKVVNAGDVIVSMTRPNLNAVAKITKQFDGQIASTGFDVLKPILIETEWLFAVVKSKPFIDAISGTTIGALYPACKASDIRNYEMPLPPLPEQKRIVEKLDEVLAQVDTIKARLDGIPDLLKRFRQSVLASAVSGKLTEEWRRDNGEDSSWKQITLKDAAHIQDPHPSHRTPPVVEGGIPFVSIGDLREDGSIDIENARKVSPEVLKEHKARYTLKEGDFIFGKIGTLGKATVLPMSVDFALSANVILIQPEISLAKPKYIQYFLSSPTTMDEVAKQANSTSQSAFGIKKMRAFVCSLPSKIEQTEIVRLVDQYFAFADTIEAQVKKAQARVDNLTQSILAKAFRGELVPQNDNDEPAEVLLKRIAQARKEAEALAKAAKKAAKTKKTSK